MKQIILASQSPRRQELLRLMGYDFKLAEIQGDESYPSSLKGVEITDFLCRKKADYFGKVGENQILITADTIVWFEDRALEKPHSKEEAVEMLLELSNQTHEVYTSVGFSMENDFRLINDLTKVVFDAISPEEAEYYVNHFAPMDKAGSYGIQDWLGLTKVSKIEGSFYNVMGFPTSKVYQELQKLME